MAMNYIKYLAPMDLPVSAQVLLPMDKHARIVCQRGYQRNSRENIHVQYTF